MDLVFGCLHLCTLLVVAFLLSSRGSIFPKGGGVLCSDVS